MMTNYVKLTRSYKKENAGTTVFYPGIITTGVNIGLVEEFIGPEGNEGFGLFSQNKNTFPHIDTFNTIKDTYNQLPSQVNVNGNTYNLYDDGDIILRGNTLEYTVRKFDDDDLTSLKQYFLENKTRDEIQYLIWDKKTDDQYRFEPFVPGLLYDSVSGDILGYIHSYIANENNEVIVEFPYKDSSLYSVLEHGAANIDLSDNELRIYDIFDDKTQIILSKDGESSVSFYVYSNSVQTEDAVYTVKNVNEFGDYTIASQMVDSNIKEVLRIFSEFEYKSFMVQNIQPGGNMVSFSGYFPKTYSSLILDTPSEGVSNMTVNIYRVPASLVPDENVRRFMVGAAGISANKIVNGDINES